MKIISITLPQIFSSRLSFIIIPRLSVALKKHIFEYKNNSPKTSDTNSARFSLVSPIFIIM